MKGLVWTGAVMAMTAMLAAPSFANDNDNDNYHHSMGQRVGHAARSATHAVGSTTRRMTHPHKPMAMIGRVNLNKASRGEIERLKGVDAATADRIIAGRPWHDAHELVDRGVLSENEYRKIHMDVSTAQAKPYRRHGYRSGEHAWNANDRDRDQQMANREESDRQERRPMAIIGRVNLNTAPRWQLEQLPDVTPRVADRIVAGRPWRDAHDLVARGIIDENDYMALHMKVSTAGGERGRMNQRHEPMASRDRGY